MNLHRPGRPPHGDILTPAEWRVVDCVRHGMSNGAIASRQGVSRDAVKFHLRNILLKLGLRTRAELRTWTGSGAHTAMHKREPDMTTSAEIGAIGQIARQVKDIEAATRWYRDVLRLAHLYSFKDIAFFDCGGVRLFLSAIKGADEGQSILYFKVPDIASARAAIEARGAVFIDAPHMIHRHQDGTEEWMTFFHDNEGRPLALMSAVPPA